MFENIINKLDHFKNELEKLEKTGGVSIAVDEDGYSDRECPNEQCLFPFKVYEQDWLNIFKDEVVYCPKCRTEGKSNTFWSSKHIELIKDQIIERIHEAWDGKTLPENIVDSLPALAVYKQKHLCEKCNARYSVIGTTYFCPCCGHNSILKTFEDSLNRVEIKLKNIPSIFEQMKNITDEDQAQIVVSSLIESSLSEITVGFQRYLAERFYELTDKRTKRNPFQNIERGNAEWKKELETEYSDFLNKAELSTLKRAFQQRHLLQHNEGIIDNNYIIKAEDDNYVVGQRLVVKPEFIIEVKSLVSKLISSMNSKFEKYI